MSRRSLDRTASRQAAAPGFIRRNRGLLAVLGVVFALTGPAAQAGDGDPVIMGVNNYASDTTSLVTTFGTGLWVATDDADDGSVSVFGYNDGGGDAVGGYSVNRNGVHGSSESASASGVFGNNYGGGMGVSGQAVNGGVAVFANAASPTSVALRTTGKLELQHRSGIATVASGRKFKVVNLAGVTAGCYILATVQRAGGFFVVAAVPAAGHFTIYINKAPTSPGTVKVSYLVLN